MITQHLQLHTQAAHAPQAGAGVQQQHSAVKVDKRPRPEANLDMTEHEFKFFENEWKLYKRATNISGQTLVDELYSTMSPDLKKLAYDQGDVEKLNTEELMMDRIKSLSVSILHAAVHTVALHEAQQLQEETVKSFAARVRGIGTNCELEKKCTCGLMVNYTEETVYHVVLAGLRDRELQSRCTAQALLKNIKDISSLVAYCTAEESGKLGTPSTVGALQRSTYRQNKRGGHGSPKTTEKCGYCGDAAHSGSSSEVRAKECRAFTLVCNKCGLKSHLARVCKMKGGQKTQVKASLNEVADQGKLPDGEHSSLEFAFYGITAPEPGQDSTPSSPPSPLPPLPRATLPPTPTPFPRKRRRAAGRGRRTGGRRDSHTGTHYGFHDIRKSESHSVRGAAEREEQSDLRKEQDDPGKPGLLAALRTAGSSAHLRVPLCHMVFTYEDGWIEAAPRSSPTLPVSLSLHRPSYSALGLPEPPACRPGRLPSHAVRRGVADTGAQMSILDLPTLGEIGVGQESLIPVRAKVVGAVKGSQLDIKGAILLEVRGPQHPRSGPCSLQMFYVAANVSNIYLSLSCLQDLDVVSTDFPRMGSTAPQVVAATGAAQPGCCNEGVVMPGEAPCSCPTRSLPPTQPAKLPCPATPENLALLKTYILDRYRSSSFNTCERQQLPLISGSPPLELHVDPTAKPKACHIPASVPLHWQDAVKAGLERDVRLGVLERVPLNTPVCWQSRMVCAPKHDGSPRRTVDYNAVNEHCPRQTHHTRSPWLLASSVPAGVRKTVLDNWHGYHSLPLASDQDMDLTTFITPWGRFRYKTAPQGLKSSGDGFTDRMDRAFEDFQRMERCVDDTLLYDNTIEEQFHRTCQFLDRCGSNGIILNPKKFQFAMEEVDFVGFTISTTGVRPPTPLLDSIRTFPSPKNITDVRSWFGMVAQVSYTFSQLSVMDPFRHLLSNKVPFSWSPDLEEAFEASKQEIVRQVEAGVRSFDTSLPTCLATDWSKMGMGYWLCQKHCACPDRTPGCCQTGWQTVYMGSRFCSTAEQAYAPIEGEALAAAWAARKCRHFLLGLPDFLLALDHKPLIPIFGSRALDLIVNPRIMNQRVKLLPFRYTPIHVAGKANVTPDTLSRRGDSPVMPLPPAPPVDMMDISTIQPGYSQHLGPPSWVAGPGAHLTAFLGTAPDGEDECETAAVEGRVAGLAWAAVEALESTTSAGVRAITWHHLQQATAESPIYQNLIQLIEQGMPEEKTAWPETLTPYFPYRRQLLVVDGVVLCGERPLVPPALRPLVLDVLHAGHAGVSTMLARTGQSLFWPGLQQDLLDLRASCRECIYRAPSNPAQPPDQPVEPDYPFSHVCFDFFNVVERSYLAMACRYSNWLSVFRLGKDDSAHVISVLRHYFTRYGIAKEVTSDGQKVLCSAAVEEFLARWGVKHRISSAYYPRANKRSEVAVKQAKRLVTGNLGPRGELDTDRFARALLEHHNSPDPMTGLSPAMVVFGRELRGFLPTQTTKYQPRKEWRLEADLRSQAFAKRHSRMEDRLTYGSQKLAPLSCGDTVAVQDQTQQGKAGRWTKTGEVIEVLPHDSYLVRIDGSRAPTQRNRRFLRKIAPFVPTDNQPLATSAPVTRAMAELLKAAKDKDATMPLASKEMLSPAHETPPSPTASSPPAPTMASTPRSSPAAEPKRLQPYQHRQVPVGRPGQDLLTALKARELQGHTLGLELDFQG